MYTATPYDITNDPSDDRLRRQAQLFCERVIGPGKQYVAAGEQARAIEENALLFEKTMVHFDPDRLLTDVMVVMPDEWAMTEILKLAEQDLLPPLVMQLLLGLVSRGSGLIHAFAVRPDLQRKGVGGQILGSILDKAAPQGYMRLEFDPATKGLAEFYQKHGFVICDDPDMALVVNTPTNPIGVRLLLNDHHRHAIRINRPDRFEFVPSEEFKKRI